jgi:DNA-binding MarR family transcriptional regulator
MIMAMQMPAQAGTQDQLERFVDLLGAYSSAVLMVRLLEETTGGELTPSQYDALVFIHRHGDCSAKALSEGLQISIPSSTRLVDRLVRKHLVDRRESAEDRRLVQLSVTAQGLQALEQVRQGRVQKLQHALREMTADDREQLLGLLERLLHSVLSDEQTVRDCCRHCGTDHEETCVVNEAHRALLGRPIEHP